MKDETAALMKQAREEVASARHSVTGGFIRTAVSSAYSAMFHAAEALLVEKGLQRASHKGVLSTIGLQYVQAKLLAPEQGRQLRQAFERRLKADYEVRDHIPEETARETISWAEAFIAAAEELLAKAGLP